VRAVDGCRFDRSAGETFALLGESGCGKSMTALSIMRLLPDAGTIVGGRVLLEKRDLLALSEAEMRDVRGRGMAMIFQEPATSLNPVLTVGDPDRRGARAHTRAARRGGAARRRTARGRRHSRCGAAAGRVSLPVFRRHEAARHDRHGAGRRSGLLIADEPTTALDVTIQAQVLELLGALQRERGMGMLLITHDLGIVAQLAQRVGVMYAGELVEVAARAAFLRRAEAPLLAQAVRRAARPCGAAARWKPFPAVCRR
jgi:peptide/nickel transport system ATP-binding protein